MVAQTKKKKCKRRRCWVPPACDHESDDEVTRDATNFVALLAHEPHERAPIDTDVSSRPHGRCGPRRDGIRACTAPGPGPPAMLCANGLGAHGTAQEGTRTIRPFPAPEPEPQGRTAGPVEDANRVRARRICHVRALVPHPDERRVGPGVRSGWDRTGPPERTTTAPPAHQRPETTQAHHHNAGAQARDARPLYTCKGEVGARRVRF